VQIDSLGDVTHLLHTYLLDSKQRSRESKVLLLPRGTRAPFHRGTVQISSHLEINGRKAMVLYPRPITCGRIADIDGIRQSCEKYTIPFKHPAGIFESPTNTLLITAHLYPSTSMLIILVLP